MTRSLRLSPSLRRERKRSVASTPFNPDSRVERSVKITKQNQVSQNTSNQSPATVERNLPQETVKADDGKQSSEESKKSEELTNYEVSSKTINTTSGGYGIDNISVAVLINKATLLAALGGKAAPEAINKQLNELEQLIVSAAGAHKERGDNIKISAVDFINSGRDLEPQPPPPVAEMLLRQSGNVLNAVTILVVSLLLIWFGLRPAARAIFAAPAAISAPAEVAALHGFAEADGGEDPGLQIGGWSPQADVNLIEDLTNNPRRHRKSVLSKSSNSMKSRPPPYSSNGSIKETMRDAAPHRTISRALRRGASL